MQERPIRRIRMTDSTTTERIDPAFLEDFSHRWLDAWNKHDGNALAQLVTEDVDFFDPAIGPPRLAPGDVSSSPPPPAPAPAPPPVAEWVRQCDRAFPDYRFEEPEP